MAFKLRTAEIRTGNRSVHLSDRQEEETWHGGRPVHGIYGHARFDDLSLMQGRSGSLK